MFASGSLKRFQYLFSGLIFSVLAAQFAQAAPVVVSVEHRVTVSYSKPRYDAGKGIFTTQVSIRNRSGSPLLSPLQLSFDEAAHKNLRIKNAQGIGKDGRPYFELKLPKGLLVANAGTDPFKVEVAAEEGRLVKRNHEKTVLTALREAQHVSAGVGLAPLAPRAEPYALKIDSGKVDVRFSVALVGVEKRLSSIFLRRIGDRKARAMNDQGRVGDLVAGDGIYGASITVDTSVLKADACLQYEAYIKNGRAEVVSPPFGLCASVFPVRAAASNTTAPVLFPEGLKAVADELLVTTRKMNSVTVQRLATGINATVVGSIPQQNLYQLKLSSPVSADRLMALALRLSADPEVRAASVNAIGTYAFTPNDTQFASQHGLQRVRAHDAWDAGATGSGVTVIVLDSGLDRTHTDFGTSPGNCQSAEDDCGAASTDGIGHGTQVAGVVGAKTNNALGVAGVAYGGKIHAIQVSADAVITDLEMIQGFNDAAGYVAGHGAASVINASFSVLNGSYNWTAVCTSIDSAVLNGVTPRAVVVNAVGNNGLNGNFYPARCNDLNAALTRKDLFITVANSASIVDPACGSVALDQRCSTSNYGAWVDMAAPGSAITTTAAGGGYVSPSGTSFSSPMVAGAAAILRSCGVALDQIESTLKTSANVTVTFPDASSAKRLDIYRALLQLNHAPTGVGLSSNSINENTNTAGGYEVGTLTRTDADTCDKHTYSIFGGADAALFSIGGANGDRLRLTAGVLNYEAKSSYAVTVRVTDFFGVTFNQPLTVNVINLNEAPTALVLSNMVLSTPENGGSVKVADIAITDDALGTNVLSLAGADAASFNIVGNALYFNGGANFEVKSSYSVTVRVDDAAVGATPDASQGFTLTITNANEAPLIANQIFAVNENSANGTSLGTVLASDPDAGSTLTYSITGPNPGGFVINPATGALSVGNSAAMDHESNPVYIFTVQVTDGVLPASATITVNVGNVNEAPTAVGFSNTVVATPENGGSLKVADIAITDDALGTNVLSLSGADAASFSLVGSALHFNGGADFEVKSSYSVTVGVDDAGVGATPDASQGFTLTITNANEAPTAVTFSNMVGSTPENGGNIKVADISVTDDAPGTNVLSLSGADAVSFSLVGSALHFNGGADFETKSSYSVTVSVDDAGVGATPDASQGFTLTITNVNEAPTAVTFLNTVSSTPENGVSLKVADIAITDDALGTNVLSLSGADAASFSLVGSALHFNGSADFETKGSYSVTVGVDDVGIGATPDASQGFTLAITSVNEAPGIAAQSFNHIEYWSGTPFDPYVGMVSANDPDAGDMLTYTVTAGNEATVAGGVVETNAFAFDAGTPGRLVVNNPAALNFEYKPVFTLTVQVTDAGGLSATATVTVNLTNDATDNGDPHINTVDRLHYDFQSAGEFVALRGANGLEIQLRQTPVSTAAPLADGYSGLSVGVSINTAVAARVGNHRVTYQPNISGNPASSGLELRVDGVVTTLPASGLDLGSGGRVIPMATGGIQVDFPDGTMMTAIPGWWSSHSVWYLNVHVFHTAAREGIMGARLKGSWLPGLSDGSAFGPRPTALSDRYAELYVKFADSWRVNEKTSLFDYAKDTSTRTFTLAGWPNEKPPYIAPQGPVAKPAKREVAQRACRELAGKNDNADCVFDVMVTGHTGFAKAHLLSQKIAVGLTSTIVRDDRDPTGAQEPVTFTATVARNAIVKQTAVRGRGVPTGTIQFTLNGERVGRPVKLDSKGQARWKVSSLKPGKYRVAARYFPARGSVFLPSASRDEAHSVK
ncbi:MAG: cadherin domain-containing protein [Nitrosomonadales bacterium]|nr:cadherin domain-containing protein [Nitrosomonadales bacterium]